MGRWRIVLDMDWDDPEVTSADVADLVERALEEARSLPGMWVDIDELEGMGT